MSNKVLRSLQNQYGDYCVDIFTRPDGTFGFEEYRRDPEDARWWPLHRYSALVFESEDAALSKARTQVAWLNEDGG